MSLLCTRVSLLCNRRNSFSDWFEVILGVPQGSILGPLLFNIFLADLFLVLKDVDIANFADDNTPFTSANNTDDLIDSLEKASSSLFKWFKDNFSKAIHIRVTC